MALIAHYRLDGNIDDSIGGHTGSTAGSVSWSDGKIGGSASFSEGRINTSILDDMRTFSFSTWFKKTTTDWGSIAIAGTRRSNTGWMLYRNSSSADGYFRWYNHYVRTDDTISSYNSWPSITIPTLNQWYHVVATRTADGFSDLYVDGVLVSTDTPPGDFKNWSFSSSDIYWAIAGGQGAGSTSWQGAGMELDDFRVYDHRLSLREVRDLNQAKTAHFKFDQFSEPTTNLVTGATLQSYGSYHTISKSGHRVEMVIVDSDGSTAITIKSPDIAPYQKTLAISGYLRLNGIPIQWSSDAVSTYQQPADSIEFDLGSGYFEAVQYYNDTSSWIFHCYIHGIVPDEILSIDDFQIEERDYVTPFTEGARRGVITDSSNQGNDSEIVVSKSPRWIDESPVGTGSYSFNGVDTSLGVLDVSSGSDEGTIAFWAYKDNTSTQYFLDGRSSGNWWFLSHYNGYDVNFVNHLQWNGLQLNVWNHIVVSLGTTGSTLYVNGVVRDTAAAFNPDFSSVHIAVRYSDDNQLSGKMSDIRFYNKALTQDEILGIYRQRASLDSRGNLHVAAIEELGSGENILDYTTWTAGSGGAPGFNTNGSNSENSRYIGRDPWGRDTVIWRGEADTTSDNDGGWNGDPFNIDNTYYYRFSTWIRVNNGGNSSFYFGLNGYNSGGTNVGVYTMGADSSSTNPYFHSGSYLRGNHTGEWMLVVAHVHPSSVSAGSSNHPDSGIYNLKGEKVYSSVSDFRWQPDNVTSRHRSYLFYDSSGTAVQDWVYPRVDKLDDKSPAVGDLIGGFDSRNYERLLNNITNPFSVSNSILMRQISEVGVGDGMILWYKLMGGARDFGGNNDGTVNGATFTNEGCFLQGNGTTDSVTHGDNISVPEAVTKTTDYPAGCTYSIWLKVDPNAVDRMSLFRGSGTIRHIEINSIGKNFRTEAAQQNGYSFGTGNFPDDVRGVWSHFVIVFAESEPSRPVRWYQNGTLFHTGNMTGGTNPDTEYFSFSSIGRSTGNTSYTYAKSFHGTVRDFRIYNRVLTPDEIKLQHKLTSGNNDTKMSLTEDTAYIEGQFIEV